MRCKSVPIDAISSFFDVDANAGTITRRVSAGNRTAGSNACTKTSEGYLSLSCVGVRMPAHRLIWAHHHGKWPSGEIDHINGDRSDNRIENLRDVSKQTNQQNRRTAQKTSRSGLIGAIWLEQRKCWKAEIRVNGATKMIGRYKTAQEAHEAYVVAKRRLHAGCTL